MVRDPHDQFHVVLHQDHGLAGQAHLADEAGNLGGLFGVEAGHRLIQQGEPRLGDEGPGHLQALLVAIRQDCRRQPRLVGQAEGIQGLQGGEPEAALPVAQTGKAEQGLAQGVAGQGGQAAEDVVQNREAGKEAQVLEGAGDPQTGDAVSRQAGDIDAVKENFTAIGPDNPGEAVDQGGLAGAVRPDEGRNLAFCGPETNLREGRQAPEMLAEAGDLQKRVYN